MRKSIFIFLAVLLLATGCAKQPTGAIAPPSPLPGSAQPVSEEPAADNIPGLYFLKFDGQEGGTLRTSLYHSETGLVRSVNFGYMLGQPFQFDGGQFYYINNDARLVRLDVASNAQTVFPWQKVTSFWVDEGLFVYFTQDYCGEGVPCNVVVADLRTNKITKTLVRNLPKLVEAGPGVAYITPAKSNDRALALMSGYGDGPGGYSRFWSLDIATGKLRLVAETHYIDAGSVCGEGDAEAQACDKVKIEAQNKEHQTYVADYLPHGGSCGGNSFAHTKEFYSPGDSWFVGCEGN